MICLHLFVFCVSVDINTGKYLKKKGLYMLQYLCRSIPQYLMFKKICYKIFYLFIYFYLFLCLQTLHRMLDARQLGLKLIANVTYGYTGASFSGRMPCIEVWLKYYLVFSYCYFFFNVPDAWICTFYRMQSFLLFLI
jgi:hypothetical protein